MSPPAAAVRSRCLATRHSDGRNAAALLVLLRVALVEHDAVARLEGVGGGEAEAVEAGVGAPRDVDEHAAARRGPDHRADAHAAALGEAGVDEPLMVHAVEKPVG